MIEKVRVSLWDIFTFFLSGLILAMWGAAYLVLTNKVTLSAFIQELSSVPASVSLFLAPLALTAIGMLYEPIANDFDKLINTFWFKIFPEKKKHKDEENALKELIRTRYLGGLGQDISNPYHLCKEYVETKQLSTTFMVFLSRYGFYRNSSFLAVISAVLSSYHLGINLVGIEITFLFFVLAIILKCRAQDFYSYLAPCVYRCYLIDKALSVQSNDT
jgi:hypothetical protein